MDLRLIEALYATNRLDPRLVRALAIQALTEGRNSRLLREFAAFSPEEDGFPGHDDYRALFDELGSRPLSEREAAWVIANDIARQYVSGTLDFDGAVEELNGQLDHIEVPPAVASILKAMPSLCVSQEYIEQSNQVSTRLAHGEIIVDEWRKQLQDLQRAWPESAEQKERAKQELISRLQQIAATDKMTT